MRWNGLFSLPLPGRILALKIQPKHIRPLKKLSPKHPFCISLLLLLLYGCWPMLIYTQYTPWRILSMEQLRGKQLVHGNYAVARVRFEPASFQLHDPTAPPCPSNIIPFFHPQSMTFVWHLTLGWLFPNTLTPLHALLPSLPVPSCSAHTWCSLICYSLVHAFLCSRLDYGNSLYLDIPAVQIHWLK